MHISWARNNRSALVRVPVPEAGQGGPGHPPRVPGARPGLQPVPGLLGPPRRRPGAASRAATSSPEEAGGQPVRAHRGRASRQATSGCCPPTWPTRSTQMERLRARPRGARRAHLRVVPAQQARRVGRLPDPREPVRAPALPEEPGSDAVEPILIWPDPPPPDLVRVLDLAGLRVDRRSPTRRRRRERRRGRGAIVAADERPDGGFAMARVAASRRRWASPRCCCWCAGTQLTDLDGRHDTFDDFCVVAVPPGRVRGTPQAPAGCEAGGPRPGPRSSSTRRSCSTSRPTRPSSTAARSTSPTWSTSC